MGREVNNIRPRYSQILRDKDKRDKDKRDMNDLYKKIL